MRTFMCGYTEDYDRRMERIIFAETPERAFEFYIKDVDYLLWPNASWGPLIEGDGHYDEECFFVSEFISAGKEGVVISLSSTFEPDDEVENGPHSKVVAVAVIK